MCILLSPGNHCQREEWLTAPRLCVCPATVLVQAVTMTIPNVSKVKSSIGSNFEDKGDKKWVWAEYGV